MKVSLKGRKTETLLPDAKPKAKAAESAGWIEVEPKRQPLISRKRELLKKLKRSLCVSLKEPKVSKEFCTHVKSSVE